MTVLRREEGKLRGWHHSYRQTGKVRRATKLRGAATGASTEGLISTRARARTRAAARTGERASDRGGRRQGANGQQPGALPPQRAVAQMTSTTPQRGPVPSQPESSPAVPLRSQSRRGALNSTVATGPGMPPTPTPSLARATVPVGGLRRRRGRLRLLRQGFGRRHCRPS